MRLHDFNPVGRSMIPGFAMGVLVLFTVLAGPHRGLAQPAADVSAANPVRELRASPELVAGASLLVVMIAGAAVVVIRRERAARLRAETALGSTRREHEAFVAQCAGHGKQCAAKPALLAHERLGDIIDFLPDATFVIDQDKRVIAWNRACEAMTGVRKKAILGLGDYEYAMAFVGERRPILIDLMDVPAPEVEEWYKYIRRDGDQVTAESFVPHMRGGQGAHLWGTAAPLYDGQGCRCGTIEVIRDVTEQKRIELALRDSELKHRTLFETAHDAILLMRADRFVDCNARSLEVYGATREQILSASPYDFSPPAQPDGRPSTQAALENIRAAMEQGPQFFEWLHCRWDKTPFVAEVSLNRLDLGGEAMLQAIVRDVSARKRAEAAVRELNASLERRVAERTAELAIARDRALAADNLKSAFLATMSHELRTPLNSIIGFTGIVLQELPGPLNAEQHKQLGIVRDSARHLLALINDVLDLSKIEARQLKVGCEPFNLRNSIAKTIDIVKPLADRKCLELRLDVSPRIGEMEGDPRRIEQVLLNLLNNAVKFTEEGTVTLAADVVPAAPETGQSVVRISVADTGIGIRAEDMDKLFQPFRQIDSGLTRLHEGTGLGLAICRRLVELLGGDIAVESTWGKGSVFTVTLPTTGAATA